MRRAMIKRKAVLGKQPSLPARSLIQLMWLASPALPVGGFSYSEGLESAIEAGLLNAQSVEQWLIDQLHLSLARGDLAALCKAATAARNRNTARFNELNAWVLASRETSEWRLQTEQMGRSLLHWLQIQVPNLETSEWFGDQTPSYPTAFALAAITLSQANPREVALAFSFSWAENMVQAATKAIPLGITAAQKTLQRLSSEIPVAVESAMVLKESERQAFSPMLAILSAQHEIQYSRLFRS